MPPVSAGTRVNTAAANGGQMTMTMASTIEQLAAQLGQAPNADPAMVSLISQLANLGHSQGRLQMAIVTQLDGATEPNFPSGSMEWGTYRANINDVLSTNQQMGEVYQQLMSSYGDTLASLGVQSVIANANENINGISASYIMLGIAGRPLGDYELTQINSNTICATGGQNCTQTSYTP